MRRVTVFFAALFCLILVVTARTTFAGPPFKTDDPEPVEYRHWELYLASQYVKDRDQLSATLPHVEANYGLAPEFMIHLLAPMQYMKPEGKGSQYGYGDTEFGVKYRFVKETDYIPQIGTFPLIEIPTGDVTRGLGNGKTQVFLPLWLQKSWGPWTTYGGGGYWFTSGNDNRDYWQFGWVIQRDITRKFTLGAELYYKTSSMADIDESKGYTVGTIINFTDNHHLLFSVGQDVYGPNYYSFYVAYQLTLGPEEEGKK